MCTVIKGSCREALSQLQAPVVKPKLCPTLMNFRKGKQAATDSEDQMVIMKVEGKKHFFLETSKGPAEGEKAGPCSQIFRASQSKACTLDISLCGRQLGPLGHKC